MAIRSFIPIDTDKMPERFEMAFGNLSYIFCINYNQSQSFFTIDLYDVESNPIVLGEVLRLNEKLWNDVVDTRIPSVDLVPLDESNQAKEITFENFGKTVFLYIDDLTPDYEVPKLGGD